MSEYDDVPPAPRWYGGAAESSTSSSAGEPAPRRRDWERELEDARTAASAESVAELGDTAAQAHSDSLRDSARTVGSAWFGPDLVRPGPGLWPFGQKARERRERRREISAETKRRRTALRQEFASEPAPPIQPRSEWREVDPMTNRFVIVGLVVVVLAVFGLAFFFTGRTRTPQPAAAPIAAASSSSTAATSSSATGSTSASTSRAIPPHSPIPSGGVAPMTPAPGQAIDPGSIALVDAPAGPPSPAELTTPEGAVKAWLSRWCAFDYRQPLGTSEARARPAMTSTGWSEFDPSTNQRLRDSWAKTVAAKEIGRCDAPVAQVSPEAPRSEVSAVVICRANRVVTGEGEPAYVEPVTDNRIVLRGNDGLWHVDLSTAGG